MSAERVEHRRRDCKDCPLDTLGHCTSHEATSGNITTSKWLMGLVVALLIAVLGAVAITRDAVSGLGLTLGPQIAVAAATGQRNLEAIRDLSQAVHDLETSRRGP